jgi:Uma2 family endonuclease
MTTAATPIPSRSHELLSLTPQNPIYRFSVEQYHDMVQHGIFTNDDRIELLEGWIVEKKVSKNPPHRMTTRLLTQALQAIVPKGWYVDSQEPITTETSEPEPDIAVIRGDTRDYADRHPGPEHVALIVEIADSTLALDRGIKRQIYAREGISTYWIVDIINRRVEVHTLPSGPSQLPEYGAVRLFAESEQVPVIIGDHEVARIAVKDILP